MPEKKRALLVMAATGNYLFSVGNVLIGLKKHSPKMFDDIVVYTDETATEQDKTAIEKIFPVTFKIYDFQIKNPKDRERLKYYSNMPYARFEMLTYLDRYKKVFWFDSDFLITGDISGLLEYGQTGISMSADLDPYPKSHGVHMFFIKDVPGYDMQARAYASGLVIFSDKLNNPLKLRDYLYEKLDKYSGYTKYAEQGILQLMIEDFKLKVEEFPKLVYHAFPQEDKTQAKLIHLLGGTKPWQFYVGSAYDEWYENHKQWIALGGGEAFTFEKMLKPQKEDFTSGDLFMTYQKYFYGDRRYQNILQMARLDEIAANQTIEQIKGLADMQTVREAVNYGRSRLKYYRYKLLSKITFGKMRKHYKKKRRDLKARLKQIRAFLKGK